MLSAAKHLSRYAQRCFAALSMTGRDLFVDEELSSALNLASELHYRAESLDEVLAFEFGGEEGCFAL